MELEQYVENGIRFAIVTGENVTLHVLPITGADAQQLVVNGTAVAKLWMEQDGLKCNYSTGGGTIIADGTVMPFIGAPIHILDGSVIEIRLHPRKRSIELQLTTFGVVAAWISGKTTDLSLLERASLQNRSGDAAIGLKIWKKTLQDPNQVTPMRRALAQALTRALGAANPPAFPGAEGW